MVVPAVISQLIVLIYNMADTFYVGQTNNPYMVAAASLILPVFNITLCLAGLAGVGGGALISRLLGKNNHRDIKNVSAFSVWGGAAVTLLFSLLTFLFRDPLLNFLGASPDTYGYAESYLNWVVVLGGVPTMLSLTMGHLLRSEGMALLGMIGLGTGGILNIAVSPLFIFTFDLGIAGAAWATGLCQTLSFAILITCLWKGIGSLRFRPAFIARTPKLYLSIVQTGMPSLTRNSFGAIAASVLNLAAGQFGDVGVAAMSIVGRVIMITNAGMIGLGQGYQPVLGYNWGAKLYRRVRTALVSVLSMATALMTVLGVLGFIFAPEIIGFFETNDPHVLEIGVEALRYQCIISPLIPVNVIGNMSYQVLGRAAIGTFLASTRQGICFLPMILLLPPLLGIRGVELAQPAAETLAFFICGFFVVHFYREVRSLIADPGAQRTLPLHGSGKSN